MYLHPNFSLVIFLLKLTLHLVGTSDRRSSRSALGRSTGNNVGGHYFHHSFLFFSPVFSPRFFLFLLSVLMKTCVLHRAQGVFSSKGTWDLNPSFSIERPLWGLKPVMLGWSEGGEWRLAKVCSGSRWSRGWMVISGKGVKQIGITSWGWAVPG